MIQYSTLLKESAVKISLNISKIVPQKNIFVVLGYHSISKTKGYTKVAYSDFEAQIKYLVENKYRFATISDLKNHIKGNKLKQNKVLLTFDDGYESIFKFAYPILNKYNIKAAVFIVANPNKVNRKNLKSNEKFLNLKQIKMLKKFGWTIGSHTKSHPRLSQITKNQQISEIKDSKSILSKNINGKINLFCYPFGDTNIEISKLVEKSKYDFAFTCIPGYVKPNTNKLMIPRIMIDETHSIDDFKFFFSSLMPLYSAYSKFKTK